MNGLFRRRHLPHWDVEDAPYFITACLHGSIPASGMRELTEYSEQLKLRPRPQNISREDWERRLHKLWFARMDELLDFQPAIRHFERADIAKIVMDSIAHFADMRYLTIAWVVMPSHVHWLFQPLPGFSETVPKGKSPREVIMHSLKSFTANECNKALGPKGQFWQQESYDHWIRDEEELDRVIAYILHNPVRAGLVASAETYRSFICVRRIGFQPVRALTVTDRLEAYPTRPAKSLQFHAPIADDENGLPFPPG